jgi:hypothetical protein
MFLQENVKNLQAAKEAKELEEMEKNGTRDILAEYDLLLPLNSIEEVKEFANSLYVNTKKNPQGVLRDRRGELVSCIECHVRINIKLFELNKKSQLSFQVR